MIPYNQKEVNTVQVKGIDIHCFKVPGNNLDQSTVDSFGDEWNKFDSFTDEEIEKIGHEYFDITLKHLDASKTIALDVGCGTGRWTKFLASRVQFIEAVDPSKSILAASQLLKNEKNVRLSLASAENIPFEDESFDLVFSLGVLHHIPDTKRALQNVVKKTKLGGHVVLYLYYALDNRSSFYRFIFNVSTLFRKIVSKMPKGLKHFTCDIIAITVYLPLILLARVVKVLFPNRDYYKKVPLAYYVGKSFNVIRNDALDRFGTPLEQRFTKDEIKSMMETAGLDEIVFSDGAPYWHMIGKRIK